MGLELLNDLANKIKKSNFVSEFVKELQNSFDNTKIVDKYSSYWKYQNFIEDNVAAKIGISRWGANFKYKDDLKKKVEEILLELSKEGTIYRKKFTSNGPTDNPKFAVDKFENGQVENIIMNYNEVPSGYDDEDIIFSYGKDGPEIREDIKENVIKLASKSLEKIKEEEINMAEELKKEGHIYKAFEDDGYIFLKDIKAGSEEPFEDIDFVVENYDGEGEYKVIDGKYEKVKDNLYE